MAPTKKGAQKKGGWPKGKKRSAQSGVKYQPENGTPSMGVGTLGGAPAITRGRASVPREECTRCHRPELPHKFFIVAGPGGQEQRICRLCQTVLINLALHDEMRRTTA